MLIAGAIKALANDKRLDILNWLRDPRAHFPEQRYGDLVKDGVCGLFIARKLRVTQASASEHLRILVDLGVLRPKKIKQWIFYRRDETIIARARRVLQRSL